VVVFSLAVGTVLDAALGKYQPTLFINMRICTVRVL
jgi:hypothetical protein